MVTENTFLRHFLTARADVDPEDQFGLSRSVRVKRVHEIVHILRKHNFLQGFTPEELRALFEDLGPSFIKVGQTLSTRSEILPHAYCKALSQLQQECEPMPFETVLIALDAIYGIDREKIFASIRIRSAAHRWRKFIVQRSLRAKRLPLRCSVLACALPWRRISM